jgi:DNA-binding response OmpR family regulator
MTPFLESADAKKSSPRGILPTRVLVFDDEPLIRWAVCTALEAAGFDAVCAASPDEARRVATEWPPPKVALVDIHPDGRGAELLTDIRAIDPDCRFVIMSTARQGSVAGLWPAGIRIIEKPFDLTSLIAHIAEAASEFVHATSLGTE